VTPTEVELIAVRDAEAMARLYDRCIAGVRQFCAAACPAERVEEAVDAAMVNFLARATESPADAAPEDLLRKATREVAAGRIELEGGARAEAVDPVCRVMPQLLAARTNGELPGSADLVVEHLMGCSLCQVSAARLEQAEMAFAAWPTAVRGTGDAWPELAENSSEAPLPPEAPAASPPQTSPERPVRVRGRRGGLVGAVKQLARSRGVTQRPNLTDVSERGA
jgi:hypothetical protein